MSGRKLGGGRVLGSGKNLAPPPPPAASSSSTTARRTPSPYAPSDASTTTSTSISSPLAPPPDFGPQDLASRISIGPSSRGGLADGGAGTALVCPICDEEMLTLLQLNRHIDDNHQELPETEQDEVKTWFDKQVLKAKRFQPLTLINSKLRGLEVFESNETQPVPAPLSGGAYSSASVGGPRPPLDTTVVDPEELVTRKHWQRATGNDRCTEPACGKSLGPLTGSINCRKCGRLFCEVHTMYQMKLSRAANHEPVRGYWCRVCETCYKSREGYNDHNGVMVDHTKTFAEIRRKKVERQNLDIQRLEKRLTRLTQLLANPPEESMGSGGSLLAPVASLAGQKNVRKQLEQSVVTWEEDAKVPRCPFCQQEFSWSFRRHHCRICGRVVCSDVQTECSTEVGLNVNKSASNGTTAPNGAGREKPDTPTSNHINVDVRMCRDCKTTIFSKRDFVDSISLKPPDQRAYETLRQFERGIKMLMPSFQKALLALQPPEDEFSFDRPPPTHAQIQEASKLRKRLTDSFTKYNIAAKRIRDMKTTSETQLRLQKNIYTAASAFLHTYMLPLKSLPKMLKGNGSASAHHHRRLLSPNDRVGSSGSATSALSPLRNGELADPGSETASLGGASEASTAVLALETEEKELRERLVVLEEQRFLVKEMITNARGARRFEEVSALNKNMEELDREILGLTKAVGGVEERWEGLYNGAAAA